MFQNPDTVSRVAENGTRLRLQIAKSALNIASEHPMGVGTGMERHYLIEQYKQDFNSRAYRFQYNTHNMYLSALVNYGWIGAVIFIVFMLGLLIVAIRDKSWLFTAFVLLLIAVGTTESYLVVHKGVILVAFFLSWQALGVTRTRELPVQR